MYDYFRPFEFVEIVETPSGIYQVGFVRLAMFGIRRTSPTGEMRDVECPGGMVDVINLILEGKVDEFEAYFGRSRTHREIEAPSK